MKTELVISRTFKTCVKSSQVDSSCRTVRLIPYGSSSSYIRNDIDDVLISENLLTGYSCLELSYFLKDGNHLPPLESFSLKVGSYKIDIDSREFPFIFKKYSIIVDKIRLFDLTVLLDKLVSMSVDSCQGIFLDDVSYKEIYNLDRGVIKWH